MTNFFSAIARRVTLPTAVRPRLPSRFEQPGAEGPAAENNAPRSTTQEDWASPRAQRAADSTSAELPSQRVPLAPAVPKLELREAAPVSAPLAAPVVEPRLSRVERLEQPPFAPTQAAPVAPPPAAVSSVGRHVANAEAPRRDTHVIERSSSETSVRSHEVRRERFEHTVERIRLESVVPLQSAPSTLNNVTAALPVAAVDPAPAATRHVEVSIGRIEIIAANGAPETVRVPLEKRPEPQSLEKYLSDRATRAPGGRA